MKNKSWNFKLTFVMSIFALGSVTVTALGISKLNSLNESLNFLVGTLTERVRYSVRLDANTNALMNYEKMLILEKDPQDSAKIIENLTLKSEELQQNLTSLKRIASEDGKDKVDKLEKVINEWLELDQVIQALALKGQNAKAFELTRGKGLKIQAEFDKILLDINTSNQEELETESAKTDQVYQQAKFMMIATSTLAFFLVSLFGFIIFRAINRTISQVIDDLSNNSEQVGVAVKQISESSQHLFLSTTEQASSLEETSSSIEEISAMVKRSSVNANTSAQSSVEGQKSFEKGKLIIGHITTSMKEINGTNKISEVLDSSFKVKTVELTMNESNERINSIIMQGKLKEEEGTKIANDCGDVLKQISVSAAEINEMVMSIATASGE